MLSIVVAVYNDGTQIVTPLTISSTEICVFVTVFLASVFAVRHNNSGNSVHGRPAPGPRGLPILGHLPQLGKKPFAKMTEWSREYGSIFKIRMGSRDAIVLNGMQMIKKALLRQSANFAGRPDFESFKHACGGYSVAFSNYGARWRLHRKIAQSAVHSFISNCNQPIDSFINEHARDLTDALLKTAGTPSDPYNAVADATAGVVFSICFGRHKRPSKDEVSRQILGNIQAFQEAFQDASAVDIMPWTKTVLQKQVRKMVLALERMTGLCDQQAQDHMADYSPDVIRDAMDAYIKAGEEITEETTQTTGLTAKQVLHSVQDIIAAGTDSMSRTMQWAILYMAKHPNIQEKVFEEIAQNIGTERQPLYADRELLPYTEATLFELSRHASVAPLALPHATTADTELDGIFIPEGTLVFANHHSVNHDADAWEDPEQFRPERFLSDDRASLNRSATDKVLIFGLGKRRCLGEELGKIELFLFFSNLLQKCQLVRPEGQELRTDEGTFVFTWNSRPFQIIVRPR